MTENLYTSCPELASSDPYHHSFNDFGSAVPLSPPSEISSPDRMPATCSNLISGHSRKDLISEMSADAAAAVEHRHGHSLASRAQPSDQEQSEFNACAIRLTSQSESPVQFSIPVEEMDPPTGHPQGYLALGKIETKILSQSTLPQKTSANSGFMDQVVPESGIFSQGTSLLLDDSVSSSAVGDTQWLASTAFDTDTTLYTGSEPLVPSPLSMPEMTWAQDNLLALPPEETMPFVAGEEPPHESLTNGLPRLMIPTDYASESLPVRGRSPIITISATSRGDSPDEHVPEAAPSRLLLSPTGHDEEIDGYENRENDHHSPYSTPVDSIHSGSHAQASARMRHGLDPFSRGDEYGPSPNEIDAQNKQDKKNKEVGQWTETVSICANDADEMFPDSPRGRPKVSSRIRALSTGDRPFQQADYFNLTESQRLIVGPGLMVHESSDDGVASEDDSDSSSARYSPPMPVGDLQGEDQPPLVVASPELVASPEEAFPMWQHDAPREPLHEPVRKQPQTSAFAMAKFQEYAREQDAASITATIDADSIRNLSISLEQSLRFPQETKRKSNSWSSNFFSKRGVRSSVQHAHEKLKRQASDLSLASATPADPTVDTGLAMPQRKESSGSSYRHRLSLAGRHSPRPHSRSPSLTSALMSMTGQMAAVGGSRSVQAASPQPDTVPKLSTAKWSRDRAKSELPRPSTPGLFSLIKTYGGPPVASLARFHKADLHSADTKADLVPKAEMADAEDHEEIDPGKDEKHVMDFSMPPTLPVPSKDGFKSQIMQLNPRLNSCLIDRFADEQVRRYRKLVEFQQKHAAAIAKGSCQSGPFCFALGGRAELLPLRRNAADGENGHVQFRVVHDHDPSLGSSEGAVAAAQFPPGVPLPPVSRLPARFECPVCFQVKEIHKPSDWSKHIYEDIQPFTCTFPECTEPKSFKRKADWVRHEGERHRQQEWWTCSMKECSHKCYRKNNFIQHLVREHKLGDDKTVTSKMCRDYDGSVKSIDQLVEECKGTADQTPDMEPCRFCGNHCGTWKKLTAHLGKHMEQLAMPVLQLARQIGGASYPTIQAQDEHVLSSSNSFEKVVDSSGGNNNNAAADPFPAQVAVPPQFHDLTPSAQACVYSVDAPSISYTSMTGGDILMEPEQMIDTLQPNSQFGDQFAATDLYNAGHTQPTATTSATLNAPSHAHSNLHAHALANAHAQLQPPFRPPHPSHRMSVSYPPLYPPRSPGPVITPNSYSVTSQLPPQAQPMQPAPASAVMGLSSVYEVQRQEQSGYPAYQPMVPTNSYVHVHGQYGSGSHSSQMG
ncbi:hypothetical protein POX_c04376 [Penicillium oxalicum]|uniref:hypothetical protein n=1 Tax=Penicillium oxalicum TaxID=69781 RepID=UPI0020B756ED|nr:hypothetical protein POX_c04376 [Penicillium oxalicum]KAI2791515.1 hypothetical protein POX_c04376 [Penicillium oxalicum]